MVELCAGDRPVDVDELSSHLRFENFLERDVNHNLSGGEIKRSEMLQLMAQEPDMVLLDEPESGVDLESIALLGESINTLLDRALKNTPPVKRESSVKTQIGTGHYPHRPHSGLYHRR